VTGQLVEIEALVKRFGKNVAVNRVSLTVSAGEVVGLVGANGAGKTTLIRMLLGLLTPDEGEARLLGGPPTRAVRSRIGYMPQGPGLYEDLTVEENLEFRARVFGMPRPQLEEDMLGLGRTLVSDLPLGHRRRVAFAAALGHRPDLLVLDEPTSGVGPLGRADLWQTIHDAADAGTGVLVTTHHMDEAEQCDRLVFLSDGSVAFSGTVDEILAGQVTVEVTPDDHAATMDLLEHAGLAVVPAAGHLRLPGIDVSTARSALGEGIVMVETPSTLEEAFMTLVAVP